jgi:pimeloyl-ACP methyl ester carboxylesterase
MPCASPLLCGLLSLCGAAPAAPAITPAEFQGWFQAASQGQLRVPRAVEQRAQRFRYVFVGGFANERMPGYFAQCAQELRAHGVPRTAIHFIFPSSHNSFDGNCDGVKDEFLAIAAQGREPLVIIAHSRGASDALGFALRNDDFVRRRVHALFLVQGAFGGTGVADYVLGEGEPMDGQMPLRLRVLAHLLGRFEMNVLRRGKHDGLSGLTREESKAFWERMQADHAGALAVVGPKTFYITSQVEPSRLRLFHRAIASYLDTYYGPNDGMVLVDDQSLPGLGTTLGLFEVGHTALTHRFPATGAPPRMRRALIQSIVLAVGQTPEIIPPPDSRSRGGRTGFRGRPAPAD